jgi:hypothetical protein
MMVKVLVALAFLASIQVNEAFSTTGSMCARIANIKERPYHQSLRPNTCRTKISMAVEGDFDPEALSRSVSAAQGGSFRAKLNALYKFSRPHTIRGSILASIAGTIRALVDTPGAIQNANWAYMLPRAFMGMIALLMGNVFIVGINQIYDKEIDELNKPFLPVASGEMSEKSAWVSVLTAGIIGPIIV